jgi:hypothetical protein
VFGWLINKVQGSQHIGRAANGMYHSQKHGKFFENILLSGHTNCNLIESDSDAKIDQLLLKNIWHEFE